MSIPKKTLLVVTPFIIGAAGGSAITHFLVDKGKVNAPALTTSNNPETPSFKAAVGTGQDTSLPKGVLSPNTVALDASNYLNKEVKVKGVVIDAGNHRYNIVGQNADQAIALSLDFSQTKLDPSKFAFSASSSKSSKPQPPKAVTVAGTLKAIKSSHNQNTVSLQLIVDSVQ